MKRSEMLQHIEYLISTCHPEEFPSAEAILKCIEDNGMLPPEYNLNKGSGKYHISSYYINEWEEE